MIATLVRLLVAACVATVGWTAARAQVSPGPLSAAHRALEGNANCLQCHATKSGGMDGRCLDCHAEIALLRDAGRGLHARTAGATCARCHPEHAGLDFDLIEWPGGGPNALDHARTGWPLEGRHAEARCRDCHQAKNRTGRAAAVTRVQNASRSWVGLETRCASCHVDTHRGALGDECARCHTSADWKTTPGFDHATTAFPLAGKHAAVACARCHQPEGRPAPLYKPLPHARCSDCHEDVHAGRLGPACASCHGVSGWREVPRSAFDHDRTRYPLLGAHRQAACAACHDSRVAWGPKPAFDTCSACHRDPHAGQATLAGVAVDCRTCHRVETFREGVLAASRHAPERFPLAGKHVAVACKACHRRDVSPSGIARLGKAGVQIRPAHDRCTTCHEDAHAGQLASRPDKGECGACHGVEGWKPSRFTKEQHRALALPLDGAHAEATCAACHGPIRPGLSVLPATLATGRARVALRGIERDCAACHRDPHRFPEAKPCSACHGSTAFAPARYGIAEHARAAMALDGAHRAVPCVACHTELVAPDGKNPSLPFRDPRRACAECHTDPHGSQFRTDTCEGCHGLDTFRPATRFDHDRDASFRLGRAHARVDCARCHPTRPGPAGTPIVAYRGVPARCEACHVPSPGKEGAS